MYRALRVCIYECVGNSVIAAAEHNNDDDANDVDDDAEKAFDDDVDDQDIDGNGVTEDMRLYIQMYQSTYTHASFVRGEIGILYPTVER